MKIFINILIVTGTLLLPGLQNALFGWLYGAVPLLVFYYLCKYGSQTGGKYLLQGTLIALLAGVILQTAGQVMLALILFTTGFILARSVVQGNAPALSGLKGVVVLSVSLFLFSGMIAITEGNHPYSMLLQSVNQGIDETLKYYQENEKIPAESYYLLAQTFLEIKERLFQLMPAIMASLAIITVWMAMVFGNSLLQKNSGQRPWPEYQYWQLPEKLVWLVVVAAILALMPLPMARTIGFNLLVIASLIYCFQGLSIFLFFLNKWKVPLFIRSLLYVIVVFQSLGTIFLSVIGLADVWFDLRHLSSQDPDQKETL
jgi:uncharacterized protein YybS (DUF2232 family)